MKRPQIIAVAACVALCAAIYLFASTKKPKIAKEPAADMHNHADHEAEQLDIEKYIKEVNAAITEPAQKEKVQQLTQAKAYKDLMTEYMKLDKPIALAYYSTRLAEAENTAKAYMAAGDYNAILMQTAPDEKVLNFLTTNALDSYQKAISLDSSNNEYRVRLAGVYMDVKGEGMPQGIPILLEVIQRDSNNVSALLMLGKYGILSGQYEKALGRLEKILYLQPENSEALLLAAQAQNGLGNRKKTIELLERYKKTRTSPEERKQVEESIKQLKQQPKG